MTEEEIERLRMQELNLWRRFCADTTSQSRAAWRQARLEYEDAIRPPALEGKTHTRGQGR
jgi:hypothetical protein